MGPNGVREAFRLGSAAHGWVQQPLWSVATVNDEVLSETTDPGYTFPYVEISNVDHVMGIVEPMNVTFGDAPSRARRQIREGDVLISTVRTYLRAIARVPRRWSGAIASTGFAVIRPRCIDSRFLGYVLAADAFIHEVIARSTGVSYPAINAADVMKLKVPVPPPHEQRRIAAFLDYETSRIDELVWAQQKLLEVVAEKRTAMLSHLLIKGANPRAALKESNLAWLGSVPNHWTQTRVGWVSTFISYGFTNPMPTSPGGPYMLTANDIGYEGVRYEAARRTTDEAFHTRLTDKSKPRLGDVLITKDGTLGRVAVFDGQKACINQSVALLRVDSGVVLPEFLALLLSTSAYQDRMEFDAGGTTIKHIYISRLAKMPVFLPPLSEQMKIIQKVTDELKPIGEVFDLAHKGISLLNERKSALISSAVTGQLDLRDWEPSEVVGVLA
ncbi:MAG: restriction endonuclease subunit S [Trueperaceae bacterium]|nr:restriction endonuclease subunit S [Trueperaceae bacterium]